MHWLEEWMHRECSLPEKNCRRCKEACVPCAALSCAAKVPLVITRRLALEKGFVSLPTFADRIADCTGASPEQRDALTLPKHRGTWRPRKSTKKCGIKTQTPAGEAAQAEETRAVVIINRAGAELGRYASLEAAVQHYERNRTGILNRCERKLQPGTDEFIPWESSCRWADEWDVMDEAERREDVRDPVKLEKKLRRYEYAGQFHTLAEWSRIMGIPYEALRKRLQLGWGIEKALRTPVNER